MDPFLPVKPEDKARQKRLMDRLHRQFIELVKRRRGEKLKGTVLEEVALEDSEISAGAESGAQSSAKSSAESSAKSSSSSSEPETSPSASSGSTTDVSAAETYAHDQNLDIFSGMFWSGEEGKDLGLVDDLYSTPGLAIEKKYGENVQLEVSQPQPKSPLEKLLAGKDGGKGTVIEGGMGGKDWDLYTYVCRLDEKLKLDDI
jgi:ClpP class serine protease